MRGANLSCVGIDGQKSGRELRGTLPGGKRGGFAPTGGLNKLVGLVTLWILAWVVSDNDVDVEG